MIFVNGQSFNQVAGCIGIAGSALVWWGASSAAHWPIQAKLAAPVMTFGAHDPHHYQRNQRAQWFTVAGIEEVPLAPELTPSFAVYGLHAAATIQANQHGRRWGLSTPHLPAYDLQYFMSYQGEEQRLGRDIDSTIWGIGEQLLSVAPTDPPLRNHFFARPEDDTQQPLPVWTREPPPSALAPPPPPINPRWPFAANVVDVPDEPAWIKPVNWALQSAPVPVPPPPPIIIIEGGKGAEMVWVSQKRERPVPFDQRGRYPDKVEEFGEKPKKAKDDVPIVAVDIAPIVAELPGMLQPPPPPTLEELAADEEAMIAKMIAQLLRDE